MRTRIRISLVCLAVSALVLSAGRICAQNQGAAAGKVSIAAKASQLKSAPDYGKLPLSFEANEGQADSRVRFVSRGGGYSLFLTGDEALFALRKGRADRLAAGKSATSVPNSAANSAAPSAPARPDAPLAQMFRMKLVGANSTPRIGGIDEFPGKANYFLGDDQSKWHTNVRTYGRVKYESVYPGVDLVFYGKQGQLEDDFVVAPGADPTAIRLAFRGSKKPRVDKRGDLVLALEGGEVRLKKPLIYQQTGDRRQPIGGRYVLLADAVSFQVAPYDRTKPLVIDPVLEYATYLGGNGNDYGQAIAADSSGNAYVAGFTFGVAGNPYTDTFPLLNPIQSTLFKECAFVSEINAAGTALVYSTFLCDVQGSNFTPASYARAIAVDAAGNAYVAGDTYTDGTPHFPTVNALQPTAPPGSNAFVAKIAAGGASLLYSTYLGGGNEYGYGIAIDSQGDAYVTGKSGSTSFPTFNALQPKLGGAGPNAFVAKINPAGSAFIYSTYLGGSVTVSNPAGAVGDQANAIAVDPAGNAYITGLTASSDFPTKNAVQSTFGGDYDAFVTEINPTGSALVYSTYLGGTGGDLANGIAVDSAGEAYVGGATTSQTLPGTLNAPSPFAGRTAFITEFAAGGTAVYSDYLVPTFQGTLTNGGGAVDNVPTAIAIDPSRNIYVTGTSLTASAYYPVEFPPHGGGGNAFLAHVANTLIATFPLSVTYPGVDTVSGVAADSTGNVYITGSIGDNSNFATGHALQTAPGAGEDAFVAKINNSPTTILLSPVSAFFGTVGVFNKSASQIFTATNVGTAPLQLTFTTSGIDFAQTNNCPSQLAAGASCAITVTFSPTTPVSENYFLDVSSFNPSTIQYDNQYAYLSGIGAPPAPVSLSGAVTAQLPTFTQAWVFTVSNGGPGGAAMTSFTPTSVTPINASSDPTSPSYCSASIGTQYGGLANLPAMSSGTAVFTVNFVGCATKPAFLLTYSIGADGGQIEFTGTTTVQLQ
jgi:hypothetical protein